MDKVKTTIEFSRELYTQAKIIAAKNGKPVSHLIRKALADRVKQVHEAEKNSPKGS